MKAAIVGLGVRVGVGVGAGVDVGDGAANAVRGVEVGLGSDASDVPLGRKMRAVAKNTMTARSPATTATNVHVLDFVED